MIIYGWKVILYPCSYICPYLCVLSRHSIDREINIEKIINGLVYQSIVICRSLSMYIIHPLLSHHHHKLGD